MMRILAGVDGSQGSLSALEFISRLAAEERDEITLYYSPPPVFVRTVTDASSSEARLQGFLAESVFERSKLHLPATLRAGVRTIAGTREPGQGLLAAADECRADLITMGARGVGPAKAAVLGNVARHVVHHASVPVLVVKGSGWPPTGPLRILLATAATRESQQAAEVLRNFHWPPDTTGLTITVIESTSHGQVPQWLADQLDDQQLAALGMGRFARADEEQAQRRCELQAWQAALPPIFAGHEPLVATGHAGDQIVSAILAQRAHLVAIGARRQGPVRRLLLGSTSDHVLTHAPCSVLVVRGHEQP